MPMNVSLTKELEAFVSRKVKSGRYTSASEVIREGLRLLEETDQRKRFSFGTLDELEGKLVAGVEQLNRGEGIPVERVEKELRRHSAKRRQAHHA